MYRKLLKSCLLGIIGSSLIISQSFASNFPVTFEHKFGTTVITEEPKNIATLDYQGADDLLALGIQPVAIRYWYGDYEQTVWPWAHDKLTTKPVVIDRKSIDYEKLASTKPDVIIALWSGITDKDYEKLAKIAPVVAVPKGVDDYGLNWDERVLIAGRAIGKEKEAQAQVDIIKAKIEGIAKAHPEWKGKTTAVTYVNKGQVGAYGKAGVRTQLLEQMGFVLPKDISDLSKKSVIRLSEEQIQMLDLDLLVWVASNEEKMKTIKAFAGRKFLTVSKEKREIFLDKLEVGAFSHASLLSLPYALDKMVIKIEGALNKE